MILADLYSDFLAWCKEGGLEFPCTAVQFYARAVEYCDGEEKLVDILCGIGIGADWRDNLIL